jgi:hypothetical protein
VVQYFFFSLAEMKRKRSMGTMLTGRAQEWWSSGALC